MQRLETLQKLQAILEAQQQVFSKTWEEMKEQVHKAILHREAALQVTRPNTPTSTSSCRTPPPSGQSLVHDLARAATQTGPTADGISRESTLQTWSRLGSTLKEVVSRNMLLEDENKRMKQELQRVQERICSTQQALDRLAPAATAAQPGSKGRPAPLNSVQVDLALASANLLGDLASPKGPSELFFRPESPVHANHVKLS